MNFFLSAFSPLCFTPMFLYECKTSQIYLGAQQCLLCYFNLTDSVTRIKTFCYCYAHTSSGSCGSWLSYNAIYWFSKTLNRRQKQSRSLLRCAGNSSFPSMINHSGIFVPRLVNRGVFPSWFAIVWSLRESAPVQSHCQRVLMCTSVSSSVIWDSLKYGTAYRWMHRWSWSRYRVMVPVPEGKSLYFLRKS